MSIVYLALPEYGIPSLMTAAMIWDKGDMVMSAELCHPEFRNHPDTISTEHLEEVSKLRQIMLQSCDYLAIYALPGWEHSANILRAQADAWTAHKPVTFIDAKAYLEGVK